MAHTTAAITIAMISLVSSEGKQAAVDFQRDIRPILADKCFQCHGPDEETREAGLRLDEAETAYRLAIVRGNPDDSEMMARITSRDVQHRMPPAESGKALSADEVTLIRQWIAQGARYQMHWAFAPPMRPVVPQPRDRDWPRNAIDAFVLDRLDVEGITPSPETDRVTWLRRLTLDLIGLPPRMEEVDAFLADQSEQAYERQIDRLLGSPHFGERWGRIWLDAARYADSDGYEKDKPRDMWFYRDWVIAALNNDMPYDQFIVEQIAGDLLDAATTAHRVATGFLRNSMVNEEGGADPEQFRMEGMFDRMDAIGKSVLGLTIQCAQCHSHKYDPLSQDEYYGMLAFLNNTHDAIMPVYTEKELQQRARILQRIQALESNLKNAMPVWPKQMAAWEREVKRSASHWEVLTPLELPFEGQKFRVLDDASIVSESYAPTRSAPQFVMETEAQQISALRLELLMHPQLPRRGPGRSVLGTAALTEMAVYVAPVNEPAKRSKVKLISAMADVNPSPAQQPHYLRNKNAAADKRVTGPIDYAIDGDPNTAWTTDCDPGRRNQPRQAIFVFERPVGFAQGTRVTVQPTMNHGGWNSDDNHNCLMGRYRFSLATDARPLAQPVPKRVRALLDIPLQERSTQVQGEVFSHWRTTIPAWSQANAEIDALWQSHPQGSTQLVLEERETPRVTSLLHRGDFLSPKHAVQPGVPAFLHALPKGGERTRLSFARWLVDRRSPTTARAIVNRLWQAYFGIGLVETSEDLGSQGTPPSHPQLLDWLAVELMEHDWRLKHIHRLICASATYRQSSHVTPEAYRRDPYNRLLGRGPRFRVDAEIVRDVMLAASGLLKRKVGGPSVYPPAPRFLFEPPASYGPKTWNEETGDDRYRRGLYTFRFRSVPYPMLETFDAVPGNVSCVRRNRSNTPLQALTLLNEPLSMECARVLAQQTLAQGGRTDASRLTFAMRRCVSRTPGSNEVEMLKGLLDRLRERVRQGHIDPDELLGSAKDGRLDAEEQAAWTLVARVLLTLDETITKE